MWLWAKRFLFTAALALQALVVVVLWTRLFDANVSRPSCQMAMIRWSFPAVWIASIVLWQLVFGRRRWIDMTLTTIAACVLSAAVAFCVDAFRPDIFEKWEMRDVDGMREYDCTLTRWYGKGGRVLLRVPEEFFHALGDGR